MRSVNVKELIRLLQQLNQEAPIQTLHWDGQMYQAYDADDLYLFVKADNLVLVVGNFETDKDHIQDKGVIPLSKFMKS